jgi:1,2-diacylglycerol 3-alpha-glucosyltransferase
MAAEPRLVKGYRIVSIGNLEGFKTYNRHMITVVAELQERVPLIAYDIYGCGPLEGELRQYAADLKVDNRVHFRGYMEYSKFREIIADCDLFVGSGTALVEAAAAGRPALIGIESIEIPETYGYLSDAEGFSYNEMRPGAKLIPIAPLVEKLLSDSEHWANVANACEYKAHEFSIQRTIEGFDKLFHAAKHQPVRLNALQIARMGSSAVVMRVSEKLRLHKPFGDRRNQSY